MTFAANSRYQTTPTATIRDATGVETAYLTRRFVPQPSAFSLLRVHVVVASEHCRLDNIAASELGDPELFWRLCDANGALDPDELTLRPGRRLRITLPAGIPGMTDA
ncbi:MAG: hypothetical protein NVS4B5_14000 [Vulcanimicrobiaceae bacterium]